MVLPEVFNALSNQKGALLTLTDAQQLLHLHQLHLQCPDVGVAKPWRPWALPRLQQALHVLQVPAELAHCVVPQLEAGVTGDAGGEMAQETSGASVALLPGHSILAATVASCPVTLGNLGAQRMAVTFYRCGQERVGRGQPYRSLTLTLTQTP